MEDTAEAYVERMLESGTDWMGILSVARCARGGKWRKEAECILREKGKMPTDEKEISKAYAEEDKRRDKASVIFQQKERRRKKLSRMSLTTKHQ